MKALDMRSLTNHRIGNCLLPFVDVYLAEAKHFVITRNNDVQDTYLITLKQRGYLDIEICLNF